MLILIILKMNIVPHRYQKLKLQLMVILFFYLFIYYLLVIIDELYMFICLFIFSNFSRSCM